MATPALSEPMVNFRVEQDKRRTANTKQHVETEPVTHGSKLAQEADVFAERVEQQRQHHARAHDPEVVTEVVTRSVVFTSRH
jgi:hypothetical protein